MNEIKTRLMTALVTTLLSGCLGTGCTATLTGGGELSIGMRNDNFLTLRHSVDGDKRDIQSVSNLDVPSIEEWIMGPSAPEGDGD